MVAYFQDVGVVDIVDIVGIAVVAAVVIVVADNFFELVVIAGHLGEVQVSSQTWDILIVVVDEVLHEGCCDLFLDDCNSKREGRKILLHL